MAQNGEQVKNGKAFEFALANQYFQYLSENGIKVELDNDKPFYYAKECYLSRSDEAKAKFDDAAFKTIDSILKIEPGLTCNGNNNDVLKISLRADNAGEIGDVRDIVFQHQSPFWEIGFSAKNNNEAVKHSRLGKELDFGKVWLGSPCSDEYWEEIDPIFSYIEEQIKAKKNWKDLGKEKEEKVYVPLLRAFRKELLNIASRNKGIPGKLIQYLIGKKSFYKIIKDDRNNLVVVKAFNLKRKLNQPYMGNTARYKIPKVNLPTRIIEFEFKPKSTNTLYMVLDAGWEISFRIHSAKTEVERSLKFDINLLGNPPVLFSQYLFQ